MSENKKNQDEFKEVSSKKIDLYAIELLVIKINEILIKKLFIGNFQNKIIFTLCTLLACRYGAHFEKGINYNSFQSIVLNILNKSLDNVIKQNEKIKTLLDIFSTIIITTSNEENELDDFIENIKELSNLINDNIWNGEDIMGMLFKGFKNKKEKSDLGQVFTPDHITSLMYRILDINKDDVVLDAACGSGALLMKSMANMINEAGGINTEKAKEIINHQIYGIEIDEIVLYLAFANILIHGNYEINIKQMDSTSQKAGDWIKDIKGLSKVIMNPPYERKYHPHKIIKNILDNCQKGTKAAFLLPDVKLEKFGENWAKDIFSKHSLLKIIKLPDKIFDEGVYVSIFIFEVGTPQNNKEIFTCHIEDDGFKRVKYNGRYDINNNWKKIEDEWVKIIKRESGSPTINYIKHNEHLSYIVPEESFKICEEDFKKTIADYLTWKISNIKKGTM